MESGGRGKSIEWVGRSREDLRAAPEAIRRAAGLELHRVQVGLPPSDWKPMPTVGSGVWEIRIHARGEFRIMLVVRFPEAIYVLHAFTKKSQRTMNLDLRIAARRLQAVLANRREGHP